MRGLIVNADDFGLTEGVNAGILYAHQQGILTSASLFAGAPATDEAMEIARRTPALGVGCHLTLVDGRPTLPAELVPTLAPDGRFRQTWLSFIGAAMTGRIAAAEIVRELEAQVDYIRSNGVRVTHLDAHKHVHTYPPVFALIARLARRFGIRAVRVPCEHPPARLAARYALTPGANRQAIENLALAPWAWRDRSILAREGLPPAARFFGRVLTGLFTPPSFQAVLHSLPAGISEVMMHPGYRDAALDRIRTRLRDARATEVSILADPATLEMIRRERIVLLNHADAERHCHVA